MCKSGTKSVNVAQKVQKWHEKCKRGTNATVAQKVQKWHKSAKVVQKVSHILLISEDQKKNSIR